MVSISLGIALVAGRNRVPRPATGKTAFFIGLCMVVPSIGDEDEVVVWLPDLNVYYVDFAVIKHHCGIEMRKQ